MSASPGNLTAEFARDPGERVTVEIGESGVFITRYQDTGEWTMTTSIRLNHYEFEEIVKLREEYDRAKRKRVSA